MDPTNAFGDFMYRIKETRFFMNALYTVRSKFLGMRNKIIIASIITIILHGFVG